MSKAPVKFAVVGMGHIGKRHAALIQERSDAELVAVCDVRSPQVCGWKQDQLPWFSSLSALLGSGIEAEVINICTPNGLHTPQALEVLEARRHVVVEKPLALCRKDAEAVIFKAQEVSRQVFAVMQNRYSPTVKWLRQVLQERRLGHIYLVQMNCFWNRDDRYYLPGGWHGSPDLDGGVLFTQFSHFVDLMCWLFDDVCNIRGNFGNFAHRNSTAFEDAGSISFDFVKGGMGSMTYSTAVWDRNLESSITIIGEKGTVKIGGQYMDEISACHIKDYQVPQLEAVNPPNDYGAYKGSASNHEAVIANVVEVLNGKAQVATTALEGMKVVDLIERIYAVRGPGSFVGREGGNFEIE